MSGKLKIIYMGTPEFAVPPLEALIAEKYDILQVITQPDKAKGRGKKMQPTPVKEIAVKAGIDVRQPEKIRADEEFLNDIRELAPDMIIVAAYGNILPKEILEIPRFGCINIHASLLPRFRGAAPIQRAILEGDDFTGVTLMYMAEGLDTGDMIAKAKISIDRKNSQELHDELSNLGARLLIEYIPRIAEGDIHPEIQDEAFSCYAPMICKNDGAIDFSDDAEVIERLVRAMNPWPSAFTYLNGVQMKIIKADIGEHHPAEPGTIIKTDKNGIIAACGKGSLVIKVLKMSGKRAMSADEFLRGNHIEEGTILKSELS